MNKHEGSNLVEHIRCPACAEKGRDNSGDNLGVFDDGHSYCFSCGHYIKADGTEPIEASVNYQEVEWTMVSGQVRDLSHRGIEKSVCKRFNYRIAKVQGEPVEVANYISKGQLVAQHLRYPSKKFLWNHKGGKLRVPLFGQQNWRMGGNRIIVTEGEIDAMTVYQVLGEKWPVVSIPSGSQHAVTAVKHNLEFLSSYKEIVLCFDNDEAGSEAALACAQVLPPGKVKIVQLLGTMSDPNAMLLAGETRKLVSCLWEAQTYRPDGIVHAKEVPDDDGIDQKLWPYPWPALTRALIGQRSHEMVMYTSGTGMGKSTFLRHLIYDHLFHGRTVGVLMLEESMQETRDDIISIMIEKPVRQIKAARKVNKVLAEYGEKAIDFGLVDNLTEEEYQQGRARWNQLPIYLYNHTGAKDYDGVVDKMRYMAVVLGCQVIVLDHITHVVAGSDYNGKGERRGIDELMGELRSLVIQTGVHLDVVSQLKKIDGKPFEEGGQISASHLRGSGSLASVPNTIIAIERNQQDPIPSRKNTILIRVLKNRFFGCTGLVAALQWHPNTMGLEEVQYTEEADGTLSFGPSLDIEEEDDDGFDFLEADSEPDHSTGGGTLGDDGTGSEADITGSVEAAKSGG